MPVIRKVRVFISKMFLVRNINVFSNRLFWLTVIIASGLGMGIIFQFTLQNFQQDVINVNVETSFLHWTNTFPAISMCLTKGCDCVRKPNWWTLDLNYFVGGSASKIQNFLKDYWELNNITSPKRYKGFWIDFHQRTELKINCKWTKLCIMGSHKLVCVTNSKYWRKWLLSKSKPYMWIWCWYLAKNGVQSYVTFKKKNFYSNDFTVSSTKMFRFYVGTNISGAHIWLQWYFQTN